MKIGKNNTPGTHCKTYGMGRVFAINTIFQMQDCTTPETGCSVIDSYAKNTSPDRDAVDNFQDHEPAGRPGSQASTGANGPDSGI